MTLDQLRVFVAVAERQHMTRAAEILNLAQSAVSASIAALEARHGVKLFHRVGRGIELTEAGGAFLAEARAVLARAKAAEQMLAERAGLARGTLRIMASQTIAGYWLPRHLVAFRQAHPAIGIELAIGNTAQVAAAVHRGDAELGFVEGAFDDPALALARVALDQLIVVVGASHPLAASPGMPVDLAALDWVMREKGSGTRSVFEAALPGLGMATAGLRVVLELPSNEAVRAAVEAGLGASALSASVAAPAIEAGLLVRVNVSLPERAFHAVWHMEREPDRTGRALLELMAPTARSGCA